MLCLCKGKRFLSFFCQWFFGCSLSKIVSAFLLFLCLVCPFPALAQPASWDFEVSSYIWLPESTTGITTEAGTVDSVLSVSDALDQLDVGVMLTGVARRDKWSFVGDVFYLNLEAEEDTPFGALYSSIESETTLAVFSGYALYQVYHRSNFGIDLGAGARAVDSDVEITLNSGKLPSDSENISDDWVDPVLAARLSGQLSEKWSASLTVDAGGFGATNASDSTWQGVALVAYQLAESWRLRGGYRHLYIDRKDDGGEFDFEMAGVLFGVGYRF